VVGHLLVAAPAKGGYTHYFTWKQEPDKGQLAECIREMRLMVEADGGIVAGPDGTGKPQFQPLTLEFNGIGEQAHEPFIFPAGPGFNFCKTAVKPYDEVVTACLLVARDHFSPEVLTIESDGSWEGGDWRNGARLYSKVLNRPAKNPMLERKPRITRMAGPEASARTDEQQLPVLVSLLISVVFFALVAAFVLKFRAGTN
jgi:hypothetical protein